MMMTPVAGEHTTDTFTTDSGRIEYTADEFHRIANVARDQGDMSMFTILMSCATRALQVMGDGKMAFDVHPETAKRTAKYGG